LHRSQCAWFWVWTAAGFGLVLGVLAIFSIGLFLLPCVTLLVGVAACRRPESRAMTAGVVVARAGFVAAFTASVDALAAVTGVAAFPLLRKPPCTPLRG
jgi:hypothetical protein